MDQIRFVKFVLRAIKLDGASGAMEIHLHVLWRRFVAAARFHDSRIIFHSSIGVIVPWRFSLKWNPTEEISKANKFSCVGKRQSGAQEPSDNI